MLEVIGTTMVITEFYNVPLGETFRYNKKWCVKMMNDEYVSGNTGDTFIRLGKDTLIVMMIKHLSPHKRDIIRGRYAIVDGD